MHFLSCIQCLPARLYRFFYHRRPPADRDLTASRYPAPLAQVVGELVVFYFRLTTSIHQILNTQKCVAECLEHTRELEGPRYLRRCCKEPKHLHTVTQQPACQNRQPETFTGLGASICENLRQRKRCLNGEAHIPDQRRVCWIDRSNRSQNELTNSQGYQQGKQKLPVSVMIISLQTPHKR